MSHVHQPGGPTCDMRTKKDCDDRYADWQAMQQVLLAYRTAMTGHTERYRKDKGVHAQLVLYLAGEKQDIENADGNPSLSPWVMRLRRAIERVITGEVPTYNLYGLDVPAAKEA